MTELLKMGEKFKWG
jgi:hypothetical protein